MKIAFVIDDNYFDQLMFTVARVLKTSSTLHEFYIFYEYLEETNLEKLIRFSNIYAVSIRTHQVDFKDFFFSNQHISRASFIRLLIPDYIKADFLYLDVDILVQGDLKEEDFISSQGKSPILRARTEWSNVSDWSTSKNAAILESRGNYFNAGVIYIGWNLWSDRNLTKECLDAAKCYSELGFQYSDQCVLNYVLKGQQALLDEKYNKYFLEEKAYKSIIVHFAGHIKPWKYSLKSLTYILLLDFLQPKKTLALIKDGKYQETLSHLCKSTVLISSLYVILKYKTYFWFYKIRVRRQGC